MELCHAYGLPHSQFTGAGDGRWTALDRAKAVAHLAYQRSVCETCGTRAAEWDESQGGDRFAYVAEPHRCVGCEVIEMEREHIPDGPDARGLKIGLRPREAS
ncbi:hypothetical protein [Streptomyces sp. NBC_00989]|uniref:hypothetical protein n=1 Tax=Streptomyces sp. NBC_00989 TaxID=2903705 RepID=UPI00386B8DD8|nr:hypothetical protein OG714_34485 [Streptomyces sp. NBC_00989]